MLRQLRSLRKAFALALCIACLCFARPLQGQEVSAAITGSVVDPTGASIVDATITAKDTERQTAYTVNSNTAGVFHIPSIPVGTYELKVRAPGFQNRDLQCDYASHSQSDSSR
jgi:hypothetical protein